MTRKTKGAVFFGFAVLLAGMFQLNSRTTEGETKGVARDLSSTPSSLACPEFFRLLQTEKPNTIIGALAVLKKHHPEYLNHYALAHSSNSLHGSSYDFPRAIVSGSDAKMVISFNGKPSQDGYERMEIMCFNDDSKSFEFRDVAFPSESNSEAAIDDLTAAEKLKPFVISDANKTRKRSCLECHQNPPRPNWDTYNLWPGLCSNHFPESHFEASEMKSKCSHFLETNKKIGRYSMLGENADAFGPGFRLGQRLTSLNFERIGAELGRKRFELFDIKYRLAEAMLCSKTLSTQTPQFGLSDEIGDVREVLEKPIGQRTREFLEANMRNHARKLRVVTDSDPKKLPSNSQVVPATVEFLKRYYGITPKDEFEEAGLFDAARSPVENDVLAKIEGLLAPYGVDIKNWSMIFGGGVGHEGAADGGFAGHGIVPGLLFPEYAKNVLSKDADFMALIAVETPYEANEVAALQKKACKLASAKANTERNRDGPDLGKDGSSFKSKIVK